VHPETVVRVKRVYDDPDPADGRRVLVDRLWPRAAARDLVHAHTAVLADVLAE
jgi:uncharacterized protein YeaO (DUF488 family)